MHRLVAFDLDDTLAPSKSPLPTEMAQALSDLLDAVEVCIISGGQMGQFTAQVLSHLPLADQQARRLHLMPTCGTRYYTWDGSQYALRYAHDLTDCQRADAMAALEKQAKRLGLWEAEPWGDILEDRGSQITFSALGQQAPLAAKKAWDPTGEKKEALRAAVAPLLPELEVRSGGSTSVDITLKGVDKAYGIRRLAEETGLALADMLFVGDRLDEGGNDYPVKALGVQCVAVRGWQDTVQVVRQFLAARAA
ncbi:HAD-IIB family hydrolase [Buchananella hordeovulneris]|uniref:phosphomannomutase n=1 Tax=Buchananella hordeovulneris TaxID=52770 RepID=A0A1Q5PU00_9ACTO|nr:HAD-IIB family hydrolase [Buchananella hordeovulneris]OKL50952.1 HAD family hydrolase [Buchananella hordeovulneris]RRD44159.1 HAD-IIB family hydrolase [Buchananella hordeovulneris]RRD51615.1 HAD-IIB family hydrolase [Buchananella hordeovulneris]